METIKSDLQSCIERIVDELNKDKDIIIKKGKNGIKVQALKVNDLKINDSK